MATTKEQLARAMATAQTDYAARCAMNGGAPVNKGPIDHVLRLFAAGNQPATK